MKQFIVPNALIGVVQKVVTDHPHSAPPMNSMSPASLRELVLQINKKRANELPIFAFTVSKREIIALCEYLPLNTYDVMLSKIAQVILVRMSPATYNHLLDIWNDHPQCQEILSLLSAAAKNPLHIEDSKIKPHLLISWSQATQPLHAVARTCKDIGTGRCFLDQISSVGIHPHKLLAQICYALLMEHSTLLEFQSEGDVLLSSMLSNCQISNQSRILYRLLTCCKNDQSALIFFSRTYEAAFALWGVPNADKFPSAQQAEYKVYLWWYNYHQISVAFKGDKRRIDYWKQYLHLCECSRNKKHAMLIMRYGQHTVTEFEDMGPVYIFAGSYFDSDVILQLQSMKTSELKSWLFNFSSKYSRETHLQNWEQKQNIALRKYGII